MSVAARTPVLGFAAFGGTGKTTLLRKIVPLLRANGLRLGLIKHSHHDFEIDRPGKDSHVLRQAGAAQMLVASARRTVLISERRPGAPLTLQELLPRVDASGLDLVLVEGFKHHAMPKIELHRPELGKPLLCRDDPTVVAVASDAPLEASLSIPVLDLNDPAAIAEFILTRFLEARPRSAQAPASKPRSTGSTRS